MNNLNDRVVLITGAAGGIGSASARLMVSQGANVIVHDVSEAAVRPLVDELGSRATAVTADLSDAGETERLWNEAYAIHGRIDALVNNAGMYPPAPLEA